MGRALFVGRDRRIPPFPMEAGLSVPRFGEACDAHLAGLIVLPLFSKSRAGRLSEFRAAGEIAEERDNERRILFHHPVAGARDNGMRGHSILPNASAYSGLTRSYPETGFRLFIG